MQFIQEFQALLIGLLIILNLDESKMISSVDIIVNSQSNVAAKDKNDN